MPKLPLQLFALDEFDRKIFIYSSLMGWPHAIPHCRTFQVPTTRIRCQLGIGKLFLIQWFYAYNFNTITTNIRFRTFRNFFPLLIASIVGFGYYKYRLQILKINVFDEYCYLRSQELVRQN